MSSNKSFWLLGLLSASCVVNGFSIEDQLPGSGGAGGADAGAGVAGDAPGGSASTTAGTSSQGGDGTAGSVPQGGKAGTAGSQGDAGSPPADAGEPGVGPGGNGQGGAPAGPTRPCDQSNGKPPLLCDDFESGTFNQQKWSVPAGVGITTAVGPAGSTKLVYLDAIALGTKLGEFPVAAAGGEVTVSFWVKVVTAEAGSPIIGFRDRSGGANNTIRLAVLQKELGWKTSGSNFSAPEAPTSAMFALNAWTCVSIRFTYTSMVLSYQSVGAAAVSTLTVDNVSTLGVDANWQNISAENRFISGYPSFAGALQGTMDKLYLDDVRIAADTSSVCDF